ncbi:hypothetical protein TorRG33x02_302280 [Trema orientale]|uniref:Transmembrane protein n=1 Tax=Trema orientale TaxID=63057 RepID=A0A2P5C0C4_TREOI|nr:hypothetical protein TorRG33x02_302280 [Trema orientale]
MINFYFSKTTFDPFFFRPYILSDQFYSFLPCSKIFCLFIIIVNFLISLSPFFFPVAFILFCSSAGGGSISCRLWSITRRVLTWESQTARSGERRWRSAQRKRDRGNRPQFHG